MRYLILLLLLIPSLAWGATIIDYDFNGMSFGSLSADSGWTMQSSGGVDDTPAIRLEYSSTGTSPHEMHLDVSSAASQDFWVEMDVKITGTMNGGMKFVKFFGSASTPSQNNMTLICDYSTQTQNRVAYYLDTICEPRYDGASTPGGSCQWTETYTRAAVDLRGGTWGHYKAHVRRADPGQSNGEVQVWFNGTEMTHLTNMNSNPTGSSTNAFAYISFGDYTNSNTATWYYWIDNLYVGTTEKAAGGGPTLVTCYPDLDGDLYPGSGSQTVVSCPTGWYEAAHFSAMTFDCRDSDPAFNPGAAHVCLVNEYADCSGTDALCPIYVEPPPVTPPVTGVGHVLMGGAGYMTTGPGVSGTLKITQP